MKSESDPFITTTITPFKYSEHPFINIIFVLILCFWLHILGTNLHKKLPKTENISLRLFNICLFIVVAYDLIVLVVILGLHFHLEFIYQAALKGASEPAIHYVHLLAFIMLFCFFYCVLWTSKTLKIVELQKSVQLKDCIGVFFLVWFYPIGIWFIQPRINRIFTNET